MKVLRVNMFALVLTFTPEDSPMGDFLPDLKVSHLDRLSSFSIFSLWDSHLTKEIFKFPAISTVPRLAIGFEPGQFVPHPHLDAANFVTPGRRALILPTCRLLWSLTFSRRPAVDRRTPRLFTQTSRPPNACALARPIASRCLAPFLGGGTIRGVLFLKRRVRLREHHSCAPDVISS